ncbi:hypothetical protein AB0392_07050 [Nonomuraea angiospora]|uniref:hypothetical protein n=1 Tax=Nonomuraea angiospora TaxID=46172 RepID=UPI00344F5401
MPRPVAGPPRRPTTPTTTRRRPHSKAGLTADLLITLTAAEHDEVNALLGRIRARDRNANTAQVLLAALRAYAD